MQVFTPIEVAEQATNKYLGVLVAAKYSRALNEIILDKSSREKKLTTQALEELTHGTVKYHVTARKRP
jgi:DNA-directed RNA polymerase subunit K/omega